MKEMNANLLNMNQLRLKTTEEQIHTEVKGIDYQDIAIIGMYTNFPMSEDTDGFWENVVNGVSCVTAFPNNRKEDAERFLKFSHKYGEPGPYLKGAFLRNVDEFDYSFFNISPKEALLMNPRQRLFLQAAWSVIEDAGYSPNKLAGSNIGVYVGHISDVEGYLYREMIREVDSSLLPASLPGNLSSIIPSRISYMLNLRGPTMTIDTACSSSLVAVDIACQALRQGECDSAIVGAVRVNLIPQDKENHKLGIESSDDETRAFDEYGDGSGMGEGVATVWLKPLQKAKRDGDHIYCVIKGSASNQDGASMGITAPNPSAQTDVLIKAWDNAGIEPATLSYIETHGTGTKLGDPIEIEGISKAFKKYTDKKQFCAIGSVKTNMGHLYDCAGLAGLIKAALALKHKRIPANLHFNVPNKRITFIDSPVYVNTRSIHWEAGLEPRRCGVSSFGLSGTNCHVVLEEYEQAQNDQKTAELEQDFILPLSAKSEYALLQLVRRYYNDLDHNKGSWRDICYTGSTGRDHYPIRLAIIANNVEDCREKLEEILSSNLNGIHKSWYCYGSNEKKNADNDITEKARQLIHNYMEGQDTRNDDFLEKLSSLYVLGADVNWNSLYRNNKSRKLKLPTYPFERNRCWIDIPEADPEGNESLFYEMHWFQEQASPQTDALIGETVLILGTWENLATQLSEEGADFVQVTLGEKYHVINDRTYVIANVEEDYNRLFQDLAQRDIVITKAVHLFTYNRNTPINDPNALNDAQANGVYSLFKLTKALLSSRINNQFEIFLVSDSVNKVTGSEKCIKPENAPLFGLGKVIGLEYPHLQCRAIDLDEHAIVQDLVSEMKTRRSTYHIAFRNRARYAEMMMECQIDQAADRNVNFREDGVYLITGGTGNLGLQVAKHLASKGKVQLVLINRTSFPDPSLWDDMISENKDPAMVRKIQVLKEIQSRGAKVECMSLDITSLSDTYHAFDHLRNKYGKINGIVHTAGVAGNGFLIKKDDAVFNSVLNPKVLGTWVIDKVTEKDDLDFFVLFSSGVALSGELGQGDYTAANCYLDTYAEYLRTLGKSALSINWVVWEGARMEDGHSAAIDSIFKAIPVNQALHAFDKVLSKDISRVLIGELNNVHPGQIELFNKDVFHLSEDIKSVFNRNSAERSGENNSIKEFKSDVTLKGGSNGSYSDVEKNLARIYREVLGYEEISIHDSFFELGGDSVQLHRLHKLLEKLYPGQVSIADLFTFSSISRLASFIEQKQNGAINKNIMQVTEVAHTNDAIAIVGMSGQFPGSSNVEEFWDNIQNAVDCIRRIPEQRKSYVDQYIAAINEDQSSETSYMDCGYLEGIDHFDYRFFRLSPKEANLTDPTQRMFMQIAWNALEDAGYGGEKARGSRTGVYIGYANVIRDSYQKMLTDIDPVLMSESIVGNVSAMLPARISHMLDFKGPNMVVDTACSSSLAAVHLACNGIRNGDCDMALVGGIKLFLIPVENGNFKVGIEASDGMTRAFDDNSDGSGSGEGVAVVVLKALSKAKADGDRIHAVIKGSALNHDGASMGITAPNPQAQTDVILQAWRRAGIHPESLAFIEAHGTGTELGDPIEINGIQNAFTQYTDKKQICAISSVKTNIGHLNEAAGVASLIKSVMALKNRVIAPTLHFHIPNSKIDFYNSPLYINTRITKWDQEEPMRCGVSSFGLSGTNCHVVLEEYRNSDSIIDDVSPPHIMTISAVTDRSLRMLLASYADHFKGENIGRLQDICYTSTTGRGHYSYRLALIVHDMKDMQQKLSLLAQTDDYDQLKSKGIFYGYHKITSRDRQLREGFDLTEADKRSLSKDAQDVVTSLSASVWTDRDLESICHLYIQGADIPWEGLYRSETVVKVSLPLYPFESNKCWFQTPSTQAAPQSHGWDVYTMGWKQTDRSLAAPRRNAGMTTVVMGDTGFSQRIVEALERSGKEVLLIPSIRHQQSFMADERAYLDYVKGLLEEQQKNSGISHIIHCGRLMEDEVSTLSELERSQQDGTLSLFLLMKAWAECRIEEKTEVIVISDHVHKVTGKESVFKPENASLFGFGKALSKEYSNLMVRIIDIDSNTPFEELMKEINENKGGDYSNIVALRNGVRYEPTFGEYVPQRSEQAKLTVQTDAVYIITGGTGAIGLEMANLLATKGRIKLVLVNRSPFPERELWTRFMEPSTDSKWSEKIRAIRQIESTGSEVILYRADVSNTVEMTEMLDEIRACYGEIKGIIHGAGITKTESITEKSLDSFKEVIRAKIYGTWLLDQLTATDHLDFFLMFSSVATWFETGYQSDYIAANAYLDSYSAMFSKDGRRKIVINWSTWKDKGMASDNGFQLDTIFKALSSEKAMETLDLVWDQPLNQLLIGEINFDSRMALWLNHYPYHLSDNIINKLKSIQARSNTVNKDIKENNKETSITLTGVSSDKHNETIRTIAEICREVLGFSEIDVHESFFEMGADSLQMKQFYRKLDTQFPGQTMITDLFEYPSVYKLSQYIDRKIMESNEESTLINLTGSDKSLEEELNQMFDDLDSGNISIDQAIHTLDSKKR